MRVKLPDLRRHRRKRDGNAAVDVDVVRVPPTLRVHVEDQVPQLWERLGVRQDREEDVIEMHVRTSLFLNRFDAEPHGCDVGETHRVKEGLERCAVALDEGEIEIGNARHLHAPFRYRRSSAVARMVDLQREPLKRGASREERNERLDVQVTMSLVVKKYTERCERLRTREGNRNDVSGGHGSELRC